MKLIKPKKLTTRNLTKFLIATTLLFVGIFGFQYFVKAITITGVTPNTGSVVGGQEVTITGDFTYNSMQQMTKSFCDNEMSTYPTNNSKPDTVTLTDVRNGQDYRVRKLADGKCWMIDNLKLELIDGTTLTPDDTNVTTATTVDFDWAGFTSGTNEGNFVTSGRLTKLGSITDTGTNHDQSNAWRQVDPSDPNLNNTEMCRTDDGLTYNAESTTGCGYLYNYYTATAGTADNTYATRYSKATGSICPAGWRLPSSLLAVDDVTNDFSVLDKAYGGTGANQTNTPAQLATLWLLAGAWQGTLGSVYTVNASNNGFINQGIAGFYWSSSIYGAADAYGMALLESAFRHQGNVRWSGFAVRCLVDEDYVPEPVEPVVPVVSFGGMGATVVGYSDTAITVIAPAHLAGKVDVIVTRGSAMFTLSNAYEYFNVPDVPNTGVAKTSATTTAVQSGLAALIIVAIATVTFAIKHKKTSRR